MKIFISGGCKNGKSTFAQGLAKSLAGDKPLYYIATMEPHDSEDEARIRRHVDERDGWGFTTLECPKDIIRCLDSADTGGTFLLDSVTALLSNEMFPPPDYSPDESAAQRVMDGLIELCSRLGDKGNIVFVSDYIYSDAALYDETTEEYRRGLAYIDRKLAQVCDGAAEVCAGNVIWHKRIEFNKAANIETQASAI